MGRQMDYRLLIALACALLALPFAMGFWQELRKGEVTRAGTTTFRNIRSPRDLSATATFNALTASALLALAAIYVGLWIPG